MRSLIITALPLLWLLPTPSLALTTHCVTTSQQLASALATAEANGDHDVIRIAVGSYTAPAAGFVYSPVSPENFNLSISGGWTAGISTPCDEQTATRPFDTWLDGGGGRVMEIRSNDSIGTSVSISLLTFDGGFATVVGGGLYINLAQDGENAFVSRSVFFENEAPKGAALTISGGQRVEVRESLFHANDNSASSLEGAVFINIGGDPGAYLINNTITGNGASDVASDNGGVHLEVFAPAAVLLVNNVVWGNHGSADLTRAGNGNVYLHYNNLGITSGSFTENIGNISEAVTFIGAGNFIPPSDSPLRNVGRKPPNILPFPVPFDDDWNLASLDMLGRPRESGGRVDIGAVEYPELFSDDFE